MMRRPSEALTKADAEMPILLSLMDLYIHSRHRDGRRTIRAFSFGKAPCRAGTATVEGTFAQVNQSAALPFTTRSRPRR
jgi:hypothetical protein